MLFSIVTLLSTASMVCAVFTPPPGQPDGIYQAYIDASGNEVHELLQPLASINNASLTHTLDLLNSKSTITRRALQGPNSVSCIKLILSMQHSTPSSHSSFTISTNFTNDLDAENANIAVAALAVYCEGGSTGGHSVSPTRNIYSQANEVFTYFCNHSDLSNNCYYDEVLAAITQQVTGACGSYISGLHFVQDRESTYGYSVGIFC